MLDAVKESQAQLSGQIQEGFAQLQSSVLAVQQSLDVVQRSLDYIAVNIQSIQSALNTVQTQISVRKPGLVATVVEPQLQLPLHCLLAHPLQLHTHCAAS